jgi:hypothetical protein
MAPLSEKGWQRLLEVYKHNVGNSMIWYLPHAKPLLSRGLIVDDNATGVYWVTDRGIEKLKEKGLIK